MRHQGRRYLLLGVVAAAACRREAPAPPPPRPQVAPEAPAALDEEAAVKKHVTTVLACFETRMREAHKQPAFAAYERSSFTDMFLFDRLLGHGKTKEQDPARACEAAVAEYKALFLATSAKVAKRVAAGHGEAGTKAATIDAEPEFIQAAGGRTAQHVLTHGDLTEAVLKDMNGGRVRPVFQAIRFGAERAELFLWDDQRIHAHTNPFSAGQREAEIGTSQVSFVGGLAGMLDHVREELGDGTFDRAAVFLGFACHAAQDLAFHRGMTRQQLAGLRFLEDGHDLYGADSAATLAEAKQWTRDVLRIAQTAAKDKNVWERFLAWSPPDGFSFDNVAGTVFKDDPSANMLSLIALTRFWLSHLPYRQSAEERAALGEGPNGLVRWEIPSLFERLKHSLLNVGIGSPVHQARVARPGR